MADPGETHPAILAPLEDVTTERLDLRRFQRGDLDELSQVFAIPEVWRFPYGRGFTREETADFLDTQMREWDRCGFGLWVARERKTGRMIGFVGISVPYFLPEVLPAVEIGWRLDPASWGKGLASEGARAALDASFDRLGLEEVCSVPQSDNPASTAVCRRIGMHFEREVAIPATPRRGELAGSLYRVTAEQWRAIRR